MAISFIPMFTNSYISIIKAGQTTIRNYDAQEDIELLFATENSGYESPQLAMTFFSANTPNIPISIPGSNVSDDEDMLAAFIPSDHAPDSRLKTLIINDTGTLFPSFQPEIREYIYELSFANQSLVPVVQQTTYDDGAIVTYSLASGTLLGVEKDARTMDILVTAYEADNISNITTKYTVEFVKPQVSPLLLMINVNGIPLANFNSYRSYYELTVSDLPDITVTGSYNTTCLVEPATNLFGVSESRTTRITVSDNGTMTQSVYTLVFNPVSS